MDSNHIKSTLSTMLILSLLSILGLFLIEVAHALNQYSEAQNPSVFGGLPPAEVIFGIIIVSMLPIFFLNLFWNKGTLWVSLLIAVLMFAFHVLHIVEHGMAGDIFITIWILITGAFTNGYAVLTIWRIRKD